MARFAFALAVWMASLLPAAAQQAEIEAVISDQFADFRVDDFAGAFDHASPMIRGMFGTPQNFGAMVRNGYPMVHRPQEYRFLDLGPGPRGPRQIVEVEDMSGRRFLLAYDMIETETGWKINGVQILPAPDVAA
jgi:hypothetical protein